MSGYAWTGMRSHTENESSVHQLGGVFSYVLVARVTPPSQKINSEGKWSLRKAVTNYWVDRKMPPVKYDQSQKSEVLGWGK